MSMLGLGSVGVALSVSDTYLDEAAEVERDGPADPRRPACPGRGPDGGGRYRPRAGPADRQAPAGFLSRLPWYAASFARMGFTDADITQVSDRLADELIIWGSPETITTRIGQQLDAGADHVVLHVLSESGQPGTIQVARTLAGRHR